jgi:hypothetical protein
MMMLEGASFQRFGKLKGSPKKKLNSFERRNQRLSLRTIPTHRALSSTLKKKLSKIKKKVLKPLHPDKKSKIIPGDTSSTPLNSNFSYSKIKDTVKQLKNYRRDHQQAHLNLIIPGDASSPPSNSYFSYSKIEDTSKQFKNHLPQANVNRKTPGDSSSSP